MEAHMQKKTTVSDALDARFFTPLRRPRTRRVGVELEFPIWSRTPPPHGNEYIYNPEDYRLVYMNIARL